MYLQRSGIGKFSSKNVTAARFGSGVLSDVVLELVRVGKRPGAHVAHVELVVHATVFLPRRET